MNDHAGEVFVRDLPVQDLHVFVYIFLAAVHRTVTRNINKLENK